LDLLLLYHLPLLAALLPVDIAVGANEGGIPLAVDFEGVQFCTLRLLFFINPFPIFQRGDAVMTTIARELLDTFDPHLIFFAGHVEGTRVEVGPLFRAFYSDRIRWCQGLLTVGCDLPE
jgi:hypothetical protein